MYICALLALYKASSDGDAAEVSEILRRADDLNPNRVGLIPISDAGTAGKILEQTPLHVACQCGHLGVIEALLRSSKVNVNAQDLHDDTPLMDACSFGNPDVVELLLGSPDVDVNAGAFRRRRRQTYGPNTPLFRAVTYGHADVVHLLVQKPRLEVNIIDDRGNTPLNFAARKGRADVVRQLLRHPDINVNQRNDSRMLPIASAVAKADNVDVVKLLMRRRDVLADPQSAYAINYACKSNAVESVRVLLRDRTTSDCSLELYDSELCTVPAITAAERADSRVVRCLIMAHQWRSDAPPKQPERTKERRVNYKTWNGPKRERE